MNNLKDIIHIVAAERTFLKTKDYLDKKKIESDEDSVLTTLQSLIIDKFIGYVKAIRRRLETNDHSDIDQEIQDEIQKTNVHDEFINAWNADWKKLENERKKLNTQLDKYPPFEVIALEQTKDALIDKITLLEKELKDSDYKEKMCNELNKQYLAYIQSSGKKTFAGFTPVLPKDFDEYFDLDNIKGSTDDEKIYTLLYKYVFNGKPSPTPAPGKFFKEVDDLKSTKKETENKVKQLEKTIVNYNHSNDMRKEILSDMENIDNGFEELLEKKKAQPRKKRVDFQEEKINNLKIEKSAYKNTDLENIIKIQDGLERLYEIFSGNSNGPLMKLMSSALKRISQNAWYSEKSDLSDNDKEKTLEYLFEDLSKVEWRGTDFTKWINTSGEDELDLISNKLCERTGEGIRMAVIRSFNKAMEKRSNEIDINVNNDDDDNSDAIENTADASPAQHFDDIMADEWPAVKKRFLANIDKYAVRCFKHFKGDINYNQAGSPPGAKFPKSPLSGWVPAKINLPGKDLTHTDENGNLIPDNNKVEPSTFETGDPGYYLPVSKVIPLWVNLLRQVIDVYDVSLVGIGDSRSKMINKIKSIFNTRVNYDMQIKEIIKLIDLFVCENIILSFQKHSEGSDVDEALDTLGKEDNYYIGVFSKIRQRLINNLR